MFFSFSMGNLKSRMTVFYSRTMISISDAVVSQSHIWITETRLVNLDSTHFVVYGLPYEMVSCCGSLLTSFGSVKTALKMFFKFHGNVKLRISKNRAVQHEILTLSAPTAKTWDSDPTVTWDLPSHTSNKWIISHI